MNLLNTEKVKYLVVGGYAVVFHGYPRTTGDIDIWISNKQENAVKVVEVFRKYGFDVEELSAELFTEKDQITRIGVPPLRIEVLTTISGVEFDICYHNKVVSNIDGIEVSFINIEQLKKNKQASGRFKDLDDLNNLN